MRKLVCIAAMLLWTAIHLLAQQKTLQAIKVNTSPRLDGLLDDSVWNNVPIATDFITNSPVYGQSAETKTEVKIIYDNVAIYIGAFIYEDPQLIRKQFTTRDNQNRADVDYFSVFIDTYKDRQNAYQFLATTRNVQTDSRLSPTVENDFGQFGDLSWDAVWDSKVAIQKNGWSVEMKIPYFTLRFSKSDIQDWGINFLLFSRRNNQQTFWNPVNPNENGFVNQFGDLKGLKNLRPPLRLSFSPYVSGGYRSTPQAGSKNNNEVLGSGGMDVKYGLNESFTLDATLVPDFGQVISDNVTSNITPFEQQFQENRPFFTEGTELFNKAGIFYTRRIGSTPAGFYNVKDIAASNTNYEIKKNPSITKLYNAIKFSGRNRSNLGIGIFNAVTQPVKAIVRNKITGLDSTIATEPLTNYNVIVLDKVLKNRSYVSLTNTNTWRDGTAVDANVTAIDLALFDKHNIYSFAAKPRYSKRFGKAGSAGFANEISLGKVSGNWQWNVSNNLQSENYNPNDLGFLYFANQFTNLGEISYNIFKANKYFINQKYAFNIEHSYLFKPFRYQKTEFKPSAFVIFKNFWDVYVEIPIAPFWVTDYFWASNSYNPKSTTQKLKRSPYYSIFVNGSSDSRKKLFIDLALGFAEGPLPNDPFYTFRIGARYRFNDRFTLNASMRRQYDNGQWGLTYNGREFLFDANGQPVLARRTYTDVTTVISGTYNFTSRMNLTFRARHFWNRLLNTNLYYPKPNGYWTERTDLTPSNYNANFNIFNLDVFYTWDFRLGSRIIFGYKNSLGNDFINDLNGVTNKGYIRNAGNSFSLPHGNEVTLRFIYFLNYEQFARRNRNE
jgi:hypothetical protein